MNPHCLDFYYVLEVQDFILRENEGGKKGIEIIQHPKFYIIKTIYPFASIYKDFLHLFVSEFEREK